MTAILPALALLLVVPAAGAQEKTSPPSKTWNFDSDKPEAPPVGFTFDRTGGGRVGRWVVLARQDAPSGGQLLAQLDADATSARFPVAVADEPAVRDLRLIVKCKPMSGNVDQACGLVFRYRNANNYYITRANALEGNIRLYYVKDGQRKQIASFAGSVSADAWHELGVEAKGEHIEVLWDGKRVLSADDKTFPDAGRVGVWTKADSVTYFDDLSLTTPN